METKKVITVRLAPELHERLVAQAKAEGRSLNQQIVYLLMRGLSREHS